jgi:hypothetical protein
VPGPYKIWLQNPKLLRKRPSTMNLTVFKKGFLRTISSSSSGSASAPDEQRGLWAKMITPNESLTRANLKGSDSVP